MKVFICKGTGEIIEAIKSQLGYCYWITWRSKKGSGSYLPAYTVEHCYEQLGWFSIDDGMSEEG